MKDTRRLDDIKFRALKQHVRSDLASNVNFRLKNTPIYSQTTSLAEFLSPAVRNLSLLGGGLGAVKGLMEPSIDDTGAPVGMNQRMGNVALNAIGGGLAGAGAGLGYKALKPGLSKGTGAVADAVQGLPNALDGVQTPLSRIQDIAQSDLAPSGGPSALRRTFDSTMNRSKRDIARTKRFFTGRGAAIETRDIPLGKTFTTKDPVTGALTRDFIPDVDRTGKVVTRAQETVNPDALLDEIATADRIAGSVAGGAVGAAAGIPGSIAGGAVGAGIGGTLGAIAGTTFLPGFGTAGGAALGAKAGGALGATAGAAIPTIIGGATGAVNGVRGTAQKFWDRGARDVNRLKGVGNKAVEGARVAKDFLGFEYESTQYPIRKIVTFASPSLYKTGALVGGGLGTGLGAINDISSTINRQQDREDQELQQIAAIDNPYVRMGTYQEYTSPEQRSARAIRNGVDVVGRGALGALVGGGMGVGVGGLAGHMADRNQPVKKGLLERIYGK